MKPAGSDSSSKLKLRKALSCMKSSQTTPFVTYHVFRLACEMTVVTVFLMLEIGIAVSRRRQNGHRGPCLGLVKFVQLEDDTGSMPINRFNEHQVELHFILKPLSVAFSREFRIQDKHEAHTSEKLS